MATNAPKWSMDERAIIILDMYKVKLARLIKKPKLITIQENGFYERSEKQSIHT